MLDYIAAAKTTAEVIQWDELNRANLKVPHITKANVANQPNWVTCLATLASIPWIEARPH